MCVLLSAAGAATAQIDADLVAKRRLFAPVGPGLKQIPEGADGKIYVLASPSRRLVREFGNPETFTERRELNRFLSLGELSTDAAGHLYYGFKYFPEPTVRQFDRFGYGGGEVQYTALDAMPEAAAMRREIANQERRGDPPRFKQVMTAMGVEKATGEVWIAIGNMLLRFDKEGNRRATFRLYTPKETRLDAVAIVVEKDRLIIGGDPAGIYEFERLDTKQK